jgi:MFS family permease
MTRLLDPEPAPPPAPSWVARLPIYYGWVNVVLASIAMSATLPGRTYGLGLIKEPLIADLGISDLDFSFLNAVAICIGAIVVMPTGWLIDRLGTRGTVGIIAGVLGISVLAMSRSSNETELLVTLTLVRGFGQGALSVVAIAMVGKWFRRRAGVAMGVFTLLLSIGFIVPLFIVEGMVKASGWRAAWDGIGFALLLGFVPLGLLFTRSTPESCGVKPDEPAVDSAGPPMKLFAALATPAFWVFTLAATCFNLVFSALTIDAEALLKEHGLEGDAKGAVLGGMMLSGLIANAIAGLLSRSRPLGKLLAVGVFMLAASVLVFPFVTTIAAAGGYALLLGISGGFITVTYFAVYGHTYGRAHLGGIQSFVQVLSVLASAAGPILLSSVRKLNGSTDPFFFGSAVVCLALAAASWFVKPPQRG